jgi:6-methylsalicylate decarboxylase
MPTVIFPCRTGRGWEWFLPSYDFHQHLWPEEVLSLLSRRSQLPRLKGTQLELPEGTFELDLGENRLERRLELLDRHEIDVAIVSLQPTIGWEMEPELAEAFDEGIGEVIAASGGRIEAFACGECRPGFVGACVSSYRLMGDMEELAHALRKRGQLLFVHPGLPAPVPVGAPPWWTAVVDYTTQMQAAYAAWLAGGAALHPELPVVFGLLAGGAPFQLERLAARGGNAELAASANVHFEPSSYGPRALRLCLDSFGADRLVFGSDTPVLDPGETLSGLRELGEEITQKICSENPTRLLGER